MRLGRLGSARQLRRVAFRYVSVGIGKASYGEVLFGSWGWLRRGKFGYGMFRSGMVRCV